MSDQPTPEMPQGLGVPSARNPQEAIARMNNANAWLLLIAAEANRDLQQFGEWRSDHMQAASMTQQEFNKAAEAARVAIAAATTPNTKDHE